MASEMEVLSVITICLNAAEHIEAALRSVQSQTYPNIEHIIIDGGSTDGTIDIIERYRDSIAYFVSEPDDGLYAAMNKGIKAATGEILFFLNADDVFCDENVASDVMAAFSKASRLDVVYGDQQFNREGRMVGSHQPKVVTREFLRDGTILHQTVFARRKVFQDTNGFSERYRVVSDYEWMLKVFLGEYEYRHLDRMIVIFCTDGRSWSTKWEGERREVMRAYYSLWEILIFRTIPLAARRLRQKQRNWIDGCR